MSLPDRTRGLTLIELMIVVIVLALSLTVGTPLLQGLLHGNRLSTESSRFLGALNLARSEAVMRNLPVSICPSAMATTGEARCSGVYTDGWIVFANVNKDKVVDPDSDKVLRVFEALPDNYRLTNRKGTKASFELINYLPDGSSHTNRTLLFCAPAQVSVQPLAVVISNVGRARLAKGWGVCPVA